jgi:dTDP-4-dehydrorhamnose reductase
VNAAAYTAVDRAEEEEALAQRINADAAGEGAEAAAALGIPFVQISTDYVFDGSRHRAWREDDFVSPINAYGRSKAAGEALVLAASSRHAVIRTSWLIGPFGHNFAKTILRLAADRDEIAVVGDQRGCPTSTLELADALLAFVEKGASGIWHVANQGEASWAELASVILAESAKLGGPTATVRTIASADYTTAADRAANSVLDCTRAREQLGIALPGWRDGVTRFMPMLIAT